MTQNLQCSFSMTTQYDLPKKRAKSLRQGIGSIESILETGWHFSGLSKGLARRQNPEPLVLGFTRLSEHFICHPVSLLYLFKENDSKIIAKEAKYILG